MKSRVFELRRDGRTLWLYWPAMPWAATEVFAKYGKDFDIFVQEEAA